MATLLPRETPLGLLREVHAGCSLALLGLRRAFVSSFLLCGCLGASCESLGAHRRSARGTKSAERRVRFAVLGVFFVGKHNRAWPFCSA